MSLILQSKSSLALKFDGGLIDQNVIEQCLGYKKGDYILPTKKNWNDLVRCVALMNGRINATKKDLKTEVNIKFPSQVSNLWIEDAKLEDKIKSIKHFSERNDFFQNLGNINALYNAFFAQRGEYLIVSKFLEGHRKVFQLSSPKGQIASIHLKVIGEDNQFLEKPFFKISPFTIKVKNFILKALESFLFQGEVAEFTSKKFRESKEFLADHLQSLGYFQADINHLLLQDSDNNMHVFFIIEPGTKRKVQDVQINFDFEYEQKEKVQDIIHQIVQEKVPTPGLLREALDHLNLSVKSIDSLLKEEDKVSIAINITKKKNEVFLESIHFKKINIPTRILYWHAANNNLIMGRSISDYQAYASNIGSFLSLLGKYTGEQPDFSENRDDPTNISITLTGKPQKTIRLITDKNNEEGLYKHILDFSNYNLSLNLVKISKYGIGGKLIGAMFSPGFTARLADPIEMIKNAGLCIPAKLSMRHKNTEFELEGKLNITVLSVLNNIAYALSLDNLEEVEGLTLYSLSKFLANDLVAPELSAYFKYINSINHTISLNRGDGKKLLLVSSNNFQKYKMKNTNAAMTYFANLEFKSPVSEMHEISFKDTIGLHFAVNYAHKFNSKDSLVLNINSSSFLTDQPMYMDSIHKLNVVLSDMTDNEKIKTLLAIQLMILHEAFDLSEILSPLNFSAKVRVGFSSVLYMMRKFEPTKISTFSNLIKLLPFYFCIVLDLTEQLSYSFCILVGPKGCSFIISRPAKNINYFPNKKLERII